MPALSLSQICDFPVDVMSRRKEDDLAYGDYHGGSEKDESSERGFLGDVYHRLRGSEQSAVSQGPVSSSDSTASFVVAYENPKSKT